MTAQAAKSLKDGREKFLSDPTRRLFGKAKRKTDFGFSQMHDMLGQKQAAEAGRYFQECRPLGRLDIRT